MATYLGYPALVAILLLRSRPWARVAGVLLMLIGTQAAHVFIETPSNQFNTWATGFSDDPAALGMANLPGVQSPALGVLAVTISLLLSLSLLASLVATLADALTARRDEHMRRQRAARG